MIKKTSSSSRSTRQYADLVGIDFSTTATKVVRLKKGKGELVLGGIDLLPAVDFGATSSKLELPRSMTAYYGCLAYSSSASLIRMVSAPLAGEEDTLPDERLRELLNVDGDFRVSARLVRRGKGKQDSSLLAAAIPQDDINFLLNMFPSGPPAPASVEVAGLAFVSAFLHARGNSVANEAVCLLEAGESVSSFVFLNRGEVALVGKLAMGARHLREKVANDLGVDEELAGTILTDRSINVSASMQSVMAPFIKQISISKDFIERHQGCRIAKVYVSGGLSLLSNWTAEVENMLHAEMVTWSPLEGIQYDASTVPPELEKQATRFAAAIGAAIGGFEDA